MLSRRAMISIFAAGVLMLQAPPGHAAAAYDAEGFASLVKSGATVVVHVHAVWCPVCKKQKPIMEALEAEPRHAKLHFVHVDFDRNRDFLRTWSVANQSVILLYKNGKEVRRLIGTTNANEIREAISQVL